MVEAARIRVLVAEDDFLVSQEVGRALRHAGYEQVATARNGVEAVELTCSLQPDVVLMDIEMPELDGLAAARKIREQHATPIVVLTAYDSPALVEEATESGVLTYLTKPPGPREIERAITVALARHEDLATARRLQGELEARNVELQKALDEIRTLRGIVPICMHCKNIRDDKGYWERVDVYLQKRTHADFTHGVCPECMRKFYPEMMARIENEPDQADESPDL